MQRYPSNFTWTLWQSAAGARAKLGLLQSKCGRQ